MFQFRFFYGTMTTGVIRLEEMKAGGWYDAEDVVKRNRLTAGQIAEDAIALL